MEREIKVVGGGLAGYELALQLAHLVCESLSTK